MEMLYRTKVIPYWIDPNSPEGQVLINPVY